MVTYSFKKRFAVPILAGTKAQTLRTDWKRHVRPGELVQLFTGMRAKYCRRLGEARCTDIVPVRLAFSRHNATELIRLGDRLMAPCLLDTFARANGFANITDMARFWCAEYPPEEGDTLTFEGVLIRWTPLAPADTLDIGAAA
ncbi:uncharacterized protein YqfB (UPF0267 family) [Methylobacterium sp. BE186]|uniref:hypothetical protein n=1 Tax=Methylobacterium sp. BE186 TaxID=2817715 RepID=UPI002866FB8E|nr:hypothetical protein [Methylobacterium sp. BE186]MDR7040271.1 uncharacterized protein YqfB (UPF0267 family) [Methylobacterium sp. BE186]